MRREAIGDPRELLTTLQQADAGAAERYSAHQIDQGRRAQQRAPVCAAASL
ncbi:hypothetical protein ABXN37_13535 [Piscinibacter sakaiensis]|uniref:hypothetical protein n=1 Tax=Piscinibacter sakaiensis TaxID=1547922 RepID=UPI0012FB30D3|nr:hypothetical protein [Piscinibacter sakaiensis]